MAKAVASSYVRVPLRTIETIAFPAMPEPAMASRTSPLSASPLLGVVAEAGVVGAVGAASWTTTGAGGVLGAAATVGGGGRAGPVVVGGAGRSGLAT